MNKKKMELVLGVGIRILLGVLIGFLLIYIEFRIWRDCTKLDILYLVGFHAIAGNWIFLAIINVGVESAKRFAKRWRARQQILIKYKRG